MQKPISSAVTNSKGSTGRNMMSHGKNSLLPPKIPLPSVYADYIPNSAVGLKHHPKTREGNYHQRTSSESFLIEEQPSWLDELLDEPDTPLRKGGHRRSSSDSFAYVDTTSNYIAPENKTFSNTSSWGSQDFDMHRVLQPGSFYTDPNPSRRTKNKPWDMPVNSIPSPWGHPSPRDTSIVPNVGSASTSQGLVDCGLQDPKCQLNNRDHTHLRSSASEADTKRAKQKFAQRSRVRKLQYIAALERNVQALEVEGSEVSAEFEFFNQQNLILSLENKALKQRLESLSQEHLIKHLEHEVLEKEAGRLRNLYQQQQQQQQMPISSHHRAKSRSDLDLHFANLSLKHKEPTLY